MSKEELQDIISNLIQDDYNNTDTYTNFQDIVNDIRTFTVKESNVSLLSEPIYYYMLNIPSVYNQVILGNMGYSIRMVLEHTLGFVSQAIVNYDSEYYEGVFTTALKETMEVYLDNKDMMYISDYLPDLYNDLEVWFQDTFLPNLKLCVNDIVFNNNDIPIGITSFIINFIDKSISITYGTRLE